MARTLATGAHVLLADEPTGNLDKANGNKLIEILGQLAHKQGYCVIIVTHDSSIAERSDKVWRMSDGMLIGQQPASS
jgi:putative ABC transport system ATP-binding protein